MSFEINMNPETSKPALNISNQNEGSLGFSKVTLINDKETSEIKNKLQKNDIKIKKNNFNLLIVAGIVALTSVVFFAVMIASGGSIPTISIASGISLPTISMFAGESLPTISIVALALLQTVLSTGLLAQKIVLKSIKIQKQS